MIFILSFIKEISTKKKIETEVEEGEGALDKQQIEEDLFDQIV